MTNRKRKHAAALLTSFLRLSCFDIVDIYHWNRGRIDSARRALR